MKFLIVGLAATAGALILFKLCHRFVRDDYVLLIVINLTDRCLVSYFVQQIFFICDTERILNMVHSQILIAYQQ